MKAGFSPRPREERDVTTTLEVRNYDTAGPYYELFDNSGLKKDFRFKRLRWHGPHYSENEGIYVVELIPGICWLITNEINEVHLDIVVVTDKLEQIRLISFCPPFDTREDLRQKLGDAEVPFIVKKSLARYLPICKRCETIRSTRMSKTFGGLGFDIIGSCERFN